jgi:cytosine/adenosine deaminase-related metal-dependent hydrolase
MDHAIGSLRVIGSTIASIGEPPGPGDHIVDLHGDRLLPGLINAHDHLQLNSLPPLGFNKRYGNVRQWIADINQRRGSDPEFEAHVAIAREARLWAGGMKNLLSGVTTVAQHDPLYPTLREPGYPVAVVTRYGWSHSLYIDSPVEVSKAFQATPVDWPWIVHAAEGIDGEAAAEFEILEELGCIQPNTVLVHGVALDPAQQRRLHRAQAALIWCPASNLELFGRTADIDRLFEYGRVALGSDSRLSGSRDLLEELRVAGRLGDFDDADLTALVTEAAARILRLADRGALRVGLRADLLVLPAAVRLSRAVRADVSLVIANGEALYGSADYALCYAPTGRWSRIRVDGEQKMLAWHLAARFSRFNLVEEGLVLTDRIGAAA